MRISNSSSSGLFPGFSLGEARLILRQARAPAKPPAIDPQALHRLAKQLRDLGTALGRLERAGGLVETSRSGRSPRAPIAISTSALDLEPYASPTRLGSTQEVNTVATSFTPRGPSISGASTALATVDGVYDGDQDDDVLTFTVRQTAVVGSGQKLRVRVDDGEGKKIKDLKFDDVAAGEPVALPNGLTLSLGAGIVFKNDTFTVDVSTSVGSAVDPTRPFDGTRNEDPNFEPGLGVVAGSFEVNGATIDVDADDSLDSVLAKITASGAGVTASFDVATESVHLTQKTPGSAPQISLGADTSGFFAATKLSGATAVPGQDGLDPVQQAISSVEALAGISTGTFLINGAQLAVDVDADSLADVLDRINASGAGVRATLDPATRRVSVTNDDPSAPLSLSDGTSGLFTALAITPGSYAPLPGVAGARQVRLESARNIRPLIGELRRALERVFTKTTLPNQPPELQHARDRLRATLIESVFDGEETRSNRLRTKLGLSFDLDEPAGKLLSIDHDRLSRAIVERPDELHELLFAAPGEDEVGGVVPALLSTIDGLEAAISETLDRHGRLGRVIDLRV